MVGGLLRERGKKILQTQKLAILIRLLWSAFPLLRRIRRGLLCPLRFLLLLVLLTHGVFDRNKALVRDGVLLCKALAYSLPQLTEREFGIWILLWHNQETRSDLASSKQRPIFILTLS